MINVEAHAAHLTLSDSKYNIITDRTVYGKKAVDDIFPLPPFPAFETLLGLVVPVVELSGLEICPRILFTPSVTSVRGVR